jgi:hypothetical protein
VLLHRNEPRYAVSFPIASASSMGLAQTVTLLTIGRLYELFSRQRITRKIRYPSNGQIALKVICKPAGLKT